MSDNKWEAYIESGREKTDLDVIDWVKKATDLGAGEILLTSVDREGTCKGFDTELINSVSKITSIPIIASGGFGKIEDLELATKAGADAVAIAHMLHYKKLNLREIRDHLLKKILKLGNLINKDIMNKLANEQVIFCKKCVESNQRYVSSVQHKDQETTYKSRTSFGRNNGICSACNYFEKKKKLIGKQGIKN